ncbi:MAG: hypothetical protein BWY87_00886 [Deltaproteobacteria bacterium ADurb.Bin510]|nr:MAG: hypothetical protein BWY87_00886 [Deltaproteobacteria bacterium ADurb.Bin510]
MNGHEGLEVLDGAGQLGRHAAERLGVLVVEGLAGAALGGQYAAQAQAALNRHGQEGVGLVLAGGRDEPEGRVFTSLVDHDGQGRGKGLAHQALAGFEADLADGLWLEPVGGQQPERPGLIVIDIDRADVGLQIAGHQLDYPFQRVAVVGPASQHGAELADVAQQADVRIVHASSDDLSDLKQGLCPEASALKCQYCRRR